MEKNDLIYGDTCEVFTGEDEQTRYSLKYEDDGVYLAIFPSKNGISKKDENRIIQCLRRKRIKDVQSQAIFQAMYQSVGQKIKIAEAQEEEIIDEEAQVHIGPGDMEAFVTLLPPEGGRLLNFKDLLQLLSKQGVVFGVDQQALKNLLDKREYWKEICVARGQEPLNGEDGKLVYHVEFNKNPKPEIKPDGSVDYRHLNLIVNVKKGQLLASIIPPTKGEPGKTVLGDAIEPKPGKNVALPKGKNVVVSEDKLNLLAAVDGKAEMIDNKINVYMVYEVKNDVDNSTGNIDFTGNVVINGNVLTGFEVRAGGYIEVRGVVEGARLFAKGDIVLKKGMQGMGKGYIESEGNVIAKFIENGKVMAKGDIIAEAIMHSQVRSGGKIHVAGRKGLIVGGSVCAGSEISAVIIGSPMATSTELEVGIDPILREEYLALKQELEQLESEQKKADQILGLLGKLETTGQLTPEKHQIKLKTIKTKLLFCQRIPSIKARQMELEEKFQAVAHGRVLAEKKVYPGVNIAIGPSKMYIKEEIDRVVFKREHGEVTRCPFIK